MRKRRCKVDMCKRLLVVAVCVTVLSGVPAAVSAKSQESLETANRAKNSPSRKSALPPNELASNRMKDKHNPGETLRRPSKEKTTEHLAKPRTHQPRKANTKSKARATIKPRTDLMYHGILEDPSRYDPRQNHQTAGAPDPQTPELTHDHFQELDRNRDGKIDPVERVFGRLDMDRDLSQRQWQ